MHYILENLSMAAQMEGNYSMTLKMGPGCWSAISTTPELSQDLLQIVSIPTFLPFQKANQMRFSHVAFFVTLLAATVSARSVV
jgi:hypothetical protein